MSKVLLIAKNLTFQVIFATIIGIAVGIFYPEIGPKVKILSDIFIRLITLIVGPIIFCTIVGGLTNQKDIKSAGKVSLFAIIYFEIFTTLALLIGLLSAQLFKPGVGIDLSVIKSMGLPQHTTVSTNVTAYTKILHLFPNAFFDAFATNNLIQILVCSVLFGIAMTLKKGATKNVKQLIQESEKIFFAILHIIIKLAPFAAFGAMAYSVATFGVGLMINFGELIISVYLAVTFFIVVVLGCVCYFSGVNLLDLLKFIKEEIVITFGTCSSEAVLPRLIEKLQTFGCHKEVVGLVMPIGYSFNLDGTSIYLSAAIIFIAQAYAVHLTFMQELTILGVLMVSSKGAASVAGGGFVTLAATLYATNILPAEGIVLLIGVDRFMSEARAVTNMIGNSVATVVISQFTRDIATATYPEHPRASRDTQGYSGYYY